VERTYILYQMEKKKNNIIRILLILFIVVSIFLVKGKIVYAEELYLKTITNGSVNSSINIETATFSGNVNYVMIRGKFYLPDGNDIVGWQLKNNSGNLVDCKSATTTLSVWGFPSFSNIEDYDNQNGMSFVIIPLTGTECNQTYSSYTGVLLEEIMGWTTDSIRISFEEVASFTSPISISDNLDDLSFNTNETKFFSLNPMGGETIATSTENTLYTDLFLTEEDYVADNYVKISYVRQQNLQSAVANQDLLWTHIILDDIITSGYNFQSTTTGDLGAEGVYYFKATLLKPSSWWSSVLSWFNPFTNTNPDIITSTTTTFIYGEMTGFDKFVASSTESFDEFIASSTTSFEQVKTACNPISGFDLGVCISGLLIPSQADISNAVNQFKDDISTHFPLGYFSDFINIISTSTTSSLTVIDAQLPEALGLGTPSIQLDLANSLDFILNATTSQFSNSSSTGVSSTATFYETTSYYWEIIVYILTLFYLLSRLIGSAIIPRK